MKESTRQRILEQARLLFNERGYNGVSMGDIADAVGISKGNLTYHFNKKEAIMEALVLESRREVPGKTPESLAELDAFFLDLQQVVQDNLYFFLYHAQLARTSPEIFQKQKDRYGEMLTMLEASFKILFQKGLLREADFPDEYSRVIDAIYMTATYWAPFSAMKKSLGKGVEYRHQAWALMHGLLTEKGRSELRKF